MSSISRSQALLISNADVLGSYIKSNNVDQLLPRIPKMGVKGDALQVASVNALATASFITSGGTADASATTYDASARSFPLRRIATKVELNGDIAQNVSMINDVFEQQIQAKMVAMWNAVGDKLINGTGVDPLPAGLVTLAAEHPAGVISLGTALTLAALDTMIKTVKPWDGDTPRAFVMNSGQYLRLMGLVHAAGFDLCFEDDPLLGKPVLHYCGVPVLVSDWITDTEGGGGNKTSVYLVILGARESEPQYGGLVWCYNAETGAGIRADGPHRTSGTTDLLFSTLELNICFASLSAGAVLRTDTITP
jgi:hypothetical protein